MRQFTLEKSGSDRKYWFHINKHFCENRCEKHVENLH